MKKAISDRAPLMAHLSWNKSARYLKKGFIVWWPGWGSNPDGLSTSEF
jgi:hypothetical protein